MRLWLDYGGWYDRQKCAWKFILDTQLVAAMAPPSGGRAVICNARRRASTSSTARCRPRRRSSRSSSRSSRPSCADFNAEIRNDGQAVLRRRRSLYTDVIAKYLPTPIKHHYQFNIRDVAKVVQGVLQADRLRFDTPET